MNRIWQRGKIFFLKPERKVQHFEKRDSLRFSAAHVFIFFWVPSSSGLQEWQKGGWMWQDLAPVPRGGAWSVVAQSRQQERRSQDFANRGQWWPWAGCPGWHRVEMSHCALTRDLAVKTASLNHLSFPPVQN